MEELGKEQREVLLFIHQSQREESLAHRRSILTAFSLSMTGLMAILAGAVAIGHISPGTKWGVALAVVSVVLSVFCFIWGQRKKAEEGMEIVRSVEGRLRLFQPGVYLAEDFRLPESFKGPARTPVSPLTWNDLCEVVSLGLLALIVILVVCTFPSA
jgi:hypothetical protein